MRQANIAKEFDLGLENRQFTLYYQPLFHLQTNTMIGAEVLVRWIHPKKGIISPGVFIPVAEQTKRISKLEKWIFKKALEQKKHWELKGFKHLEMSINLSCRTLASETDFQEIMTIISTSEVEYTKLIIEITETSSLLNLEDASKRLNQLKKLGVKIALDDFGTGYSTLTLLNLLPIDIIKIDKSFVDLITKSKKNSSIIKNTISMAHDLNCRVVAEGIENYDQLTCLKEYSCENGQGYLLCMPLQKEKVNEFIKYAVIKK